jgi:hypothetical protein
VATSDLKELKSGNGQLGSILSKCQLVTRFQRDNWRTFFSDFFVLANSICASDQTLRVGPFIDRFLLGPAGAGRPLSIDLPVKYRLATF